MSNKNIKKECEELWAKNKYYVLSKSHKTYLDIREYLKEKEVDILVLNEKIQKVRDMKESKKDFRNAILHIWGYFKKQSSEYINTLLTRYPNKYLQESTLLIGVENEIMA